MKAKQQAEAETRFSRSGLGAHDRNNSGAEVKARAFTGTAVRVGAAVLIFAEERSLRELTSPNGTPGQVVWHLAKSSVDDSDFFRLEVRRQHDLEHLDVFAVSDLAVTNLRRLMHA